MKTNVLTLAITLTVGIILAGSLLMPVLSDATTTERTFDNDGFFFMKEYDTTTPVTITWDHTAPSIISVNGEDCNFTAPANLWVSYGIGDNWFIRAAGEDHNRTIQVSYGGTNAAAASVTSGTDLKIVCEEGTATIEIYTSGVVTRTNTASYTEFYVISNEGPYVMKNNTIPAYMAADSEFIGLGSTSITGGGLIVCKITGTIETGATVELIAQTTGVDAEVVEDSVKINYESLSGYEGYKLTSIQFDVSNGGVEDTVTYTYFAIPATVTLELSNHLDSGEIAILNALPILIIVALVMMAVGALYLKRDD